MARGAFALTALAFFALISFWADTSYGARKGRELTLEELTNASDSVIIGKVRTKKAQFVGRMIQTDYEVEVTERLKGNGRGAKEVMELTVPGGELTTPPISQSVSYAPLMHQGEEVILFVKEGPAPVAPAIADKVDKNSKLMKSPQIVNWSEGKFSVVTDKRDGRKKVTRVNPEEYGWVAHERALRGMLAAVAAGAENVTSGPVVDLGGGLVARPEGKQMLEKMAAGTQGAIEEQKKNGAKLNRGQGASTKAPGEVRAQDLEDFKAKVRSFAK